MSAPCSNAPIASESQTRTGQTPLADSHGSAGDTNTGPEPAVTTLGGAGPALMPALRTLLERFGISLHFIAQRRAIPGSFWGEPEAGLIATQSSCKGTTERVTGQGADLYARADTPVHSVLHEACHYICMDTKRRGTLHTDAGGTALEECGVCYLSILLADRLPDFGRSAMLEDMDRWGYSFRLGSSTAWFETDADDARQWLQAYGLVDTEQRITWNVREGSASLPSHESALMKP